jgi:AsmA-like C-terminal region
MGSDTIQQSAPRPGTPPSRLGLRNRNVLWAAIALLCGVIFLFLCVRFWPFSERAVIQNLQEAGDSRVEIRSLRRTYFPYPGCVLEGVSFTRGKSGGTPLIQIQKLTIETSYPALLARHLNRITAEGMHITIPPFGTAPHFRTTRSTITIGEIDANGTILDFTLRDPKESLLRFEIHEASLQNVGWRDPLTYSVRLHNPEPPSEISSAGKFGVWNQDDPGQTPLSGVYKFDRADLSVYNGLAGTLSSTGTFNGNLGHIDVTGATDTPDFTVTQGNHPVHLATEFSAYVDGTRGDVFLKHVDARFGKTHVEASGSIAKQISKDRVDRGKDENPRIALLDLSAENGRIEDVLRFFVVKDRPPMSGEITLHARVELPSGGERFLRRIHLQGNFGIGAGKFSKPSTQEQVDKLSAGARGEKDPVDPATVLTNLTGQVEFSQGTATLEDISFGVPGASARMRGTYDLIAHKIDLHGQMQLDSKISNTTSGVRSLLLKVMDPFFKKRKKGELLPVRVLGTYEHPSFRLAIEDEKAEHVPPPKK